MSQASQNALDIAIDNYLNGQDSFPMIAQLVNAGLTPNLPHRNRVYDKFIENLAAAGMAPSDYLPSWDPEKSAATRNALDIAFDDYLNGGSFDMVATLIKAGATPSRIPTGYKTEITPTLLQKESKAGGVDSADVNIGSKPIDIAYDNFINGKGGFDVIALLIKNGAELPRRKDVLINGNTPINLALDKYNNGSNNFEVIKSLVESGATPNLINQSRFTKQVGSQGGKLEGAVGRLAAEREQYTQGGGMGTPA
jgi:hypothetical protein